MFRVDARLAITEIVTEMEEIDDTYLSRTRCKRRGVRMEFIRFLIGGGGNSSSRIMRNFFCLNWYIIGMVSIRFDRSMGKFARWKFVTPLPTREET